MSITSDEDIVYRLQQAQKKILIELDRVCKELNLTYCMAFGSSLGAVRHNGFIPWDDDIDVYMHIDDLEILQKNSSLFQDGFFLQHHDSDPEYGLMITRLRDSSTTLIEKDETERDINHGIFIDIYPLFNTPKSGLGARRLLVSSMVYRLMLYGRIPRNRGLVMRCGSTILLKIVPKKGRSRIIGYAYKVMKSSRITGYLSSLYGDEADVRYPREWFFPVEWVPFDDIEVPIEADSDSYLKLTYGDYMQLPPVEKRTFHHEYEYVDFDRSYLVFRGIRYCRESLK